MNTRIKGILLASYIMVSIVIAGNVTVKEEGDLDVDRDLTVHQDATVNGNLDVWCNLDAESIEAYEAEVTDFLIAQGYISSNEQDCSLFICPGAYIGDLFVGGAGGGSGSIYVSGDALYAGNVNIAGTMTCNKLDATTIDPQWVQYELQARADVIKSVSETVAPEKQGDAIVFFNQDTKRLETYIPAEGKFYDLTGKLIHSLPRPVEPVRQFKTEYYLDRGSGQIKTRKKAIANRYCIKEGVELDKNTGKFLDIASGQEVVREQAIEMYAASEEVFYDMNGNVLRIKEKKQPTRKAFHYLDSDTGQLKVQRNLVRGRHRVRPGFAIDRQTGNFVHIRSGEIVPREKAVEYQDAESTMERISRIKQKRKDTKR